ncbi:acyl carrier protein [Lachnospiraceae bacterium 48-33]
MLRSYKELMMDKNEIFNSIKELCKEELDIDLENADITDLISDYKIDSVGFMMLSVLIEDQTSGTMDDEVYMLDGFSELTFEKLIDMVR